MKDVRGMPGTIGGLLLRFSQCVMGTTDDFPSVPAFWSPLLTFAAASAAACITVFIGNDVGICSQNHCTAFETSTAMAFLSWFVALPSFLLNFWSLASR